MKENILADLTEKMIYAMYERAIKEQLEEMFEDFITEYDFRILARDTMHDVLKNDKEIQSMIKEKFINAINDKLK